MIPDEIQGAFYKGKRTERFPLVVNDVVTVLEGRKPREKAAVISIWEIEPSVTYVVEHGDGSGDIVALENLKAEE